MFYNRLDDWSFIGKYPEKLDGNNDKFNFLVNQFSE